MFQQQTVQDGNSVNEESQKPEPDGGSETPMFPDFGPDIAYELEITIVEVRCLFCSGRSCTLMLSHIRFIGYRKMDFLSS